MTGPDQNNLGLAYWAMPTGDGAANLAKAVACNEAALRVYTEADYPRDWARAEHNLGNAYANLPTEDRAANLAKAVACCEAALRVYTEADCLLEWAWTQNNLGNASRFLSDLRDAPYFLNRAREAFEAARRGFEAMGLSPEAQEAARAAAAIKIEQ